MAIDYSTLTDEELKAIANNDYSKLSDATLEAIANKPKSAQSKPVEGQGGAAFGVYRPQGRRPESQQDREAAKDMPLQTARGVVTGSLGAIPDVLNLPGNLYGAATGQQSPYQVPFGSEQWNEMLPFKSDAPSAKLARLGGEVMAPFPTVKGLQTIPKAAGAIGDVVSGAVGTGTNYIAKPGRPVRGYQVPSQRNPIGATFTPPEEFAKFERGELPYGQMPEQRPIGELPEGRLDKAAMMLSGGNIPNAGQGAKAFGERLGETYRNPYTAAADIGSMFFTGGVPVLSTLRGGLAGVQALADMRLANKGFTPELPKILNEYQTGVRPMPGIQPGPMPRDFQAAGPISPGGMAAPTPAAQAAMATTQAKAPSMPKPAPQPRQPFTLPDVATHYAQAEQGSTNFGDTFNKAVAARTADLLKDAQQRGQKLTREMADAMAYDEIKAWRSENVDAFKPKPEPPELVGPVKPTELPPEPAPVKRQPVYNTPGEMRKALVGKVTPDEMDRLVREKFPAVEPTKPTGSLFEAPVAETSASNDPLQSWVDEISGKTKLRNDPVAAREKFLSEVKTLTENLKTQRQENKVAFGDRITPIHDKETNRLLNIGSIENKQMYGPVRGNPKDDITERTAIRSMINNTGQGAVRQANKKISVNKDFYNDLADQAGITLDWNSAPSIAGQTLKDARSTMNKWMYNEMDKGIPELGLNTRKESFVSEGKRHTKELDAQRAKMTPEELAAEKAQNEEILPDLQKRMDKLLGKTTSKSTPKQTTPEVSGPVVPEGTTSPPPMTKEQLLDLIKNRQKNKAPPDVMEMISDEPSAIKKIQDAPWLSPDEFNQEVFMKELGKGSDKEFIAKMRSPDGDVIRAVDKELDSEMFKYPDGSGFLVRKDLEMPNTADYSIFNTDGTRYEITKIKDDIRKITLNRGDEIIADYVKPLGSNKGVWAIMDRGPEGGGQMIYKSDVKFSKDPQTRKLHKELPKIDFESVVKEQLDRAQEVKGK